MKGIISLLCLCFCFTTAQAQEVVSMELRSVAIGSDSLEVSLMIGAPQDSLSLGIWAFEFAMELDPKIQYLEVQSVATLSGKDGWTVAANTAKKKTAGFSSSRDAILVGGTLVSMILLSDSTLVDPLICVVGLRLNSGNPLPNPEKICLLPVQKG